MVTIETTFIGVVETFSFKHDRGFMGIYVKPLYIWDLINSEWLKINGLNKPKTKYFLYPHLLMLPQHYDCPSGYNPLYFLDTCKSTSLNEFADIQKTFILYDSFE
jgi:hypothetical protein